ncbi:MAG: isoprenyl transferase [Culicoidibacterales bacterium]
MLNLFRKKTVVEPVVIDQLTLDELKATVMAKEIPNHIAVIMDGNGRWANQRGLTRTAGHKRGVQTIEEIAEAAAAVGVKMMTVYAFSTENWSRPEAEVKYIMSLPEQFLKTFVPSAQADNIQVRCIGDVTRLDPKVQAVIQDGIDKTANNTGMVFNIAVNYGGRLELTRATQLIAADVASGKLTPEDVTEAVFADYLYTPEYPEVELLIRTSGEERISNFLLWQIAYAEFYFTDTLWPDFNAQELYEAIATYQNRDRRKGGLSQK